MARTADKARSDKLAREIERIRSDFSRRLAEASKKYKTEIMRILQAIDAEQAEEVRRRILKM